MTASAAPSPATVLVDRLVAALGKRNAHRALDVILDKISIVDLAALAYDWEGTWARPKQLPPEGQWRSWGFLAGRGFGKTVAITPHIVGEVQAGRAMCIGMAAQNETKTISVQVKGLIDASPPWFAPEWRATAKELHWPNGAFAYALTPEVPDAIRAPNMNLCWLSEVQSWPAATRDEAYSNFKFATRVGYARTIWDATPKRGHPILKSLRERAALDPKRHVIVRGSMRENIRNLSADVIADLEAEFGGTRKGREELDGEELDESENTVAQEAWIESARRFAPPSYVSSGLGIDPATTSRRGSDTTGIVLFGVGPDGQGYVREDHSGELDAPMWGALVLDLYETHRCDLVVVETNKGGDLLIRNLNAASYERAEKKRASGRLTIVKVDVKDKPTHVRGTVFVKEVFARGEKLDRAQPLSTAYERGRISHVRGANLTKLEETVTTWEAKPGAKSPGDLDALVHIAVEMLGLSSSVPDNRDAMKGIKEIGERLLAPTPPPRMSLAALVGGGGGGRI